ncbi:MULTISPECIES: chromate resistance protein ChrB domain-containing protein [Ralstonia solanacearum species complex]|uniref:Chromate resistance protein n=1 Tax=Ralstonia solanacearum TaxID=305 RepID=A0AAE3V4H3_RALSL|nr:chromate resistance protein ChrB domain-containing protein [Ralstonia solanacearum]MBB6581157.1 chromate resistance protein [Ralstonia solanacearum]MDB0521146.1 chromate resistance protein [Ralstonia solanacearum]MDN4064342.1 chromate resistance protein [Ralstonia solanacearum]NUU71728.1 chromate resistance protein [Ralstonia solanacearum]QHB59808.1 hypothetical protein GRD98_12435 [Ralstonia solanacearum]
MDPTSQSSGLYAISLGLPHRLTDDQVTLEHGLAICDALYAWFKPGQTKRHRRPPQMPA